jgi:hypothetical protein
MLAAMKRSSLRVGASAAVLPLVLAGCASAVVVESEFPTPVVESLPLAVGLFYDPQLRDFIHAEALPRSSTWTIDLGDANLAMLEPLYHAMFAITQEIDTLPPSDSDAASVDVILSSALNRFEFDVPRTTRDQFVEVWLQYRLELRDPGGNVVIDWPVEGYGKAEIVGSRESAVHRAAIVAMREAGAKISTEFLTQPAVQDWLDEKFNEG